MKGNPNLYEINTAVWLYELSGKHGTRMTLGQVPASEWDMLKEAGFHIVWLMGVWKRCPSDREYFLADPHNISLCNTILPGWTEEDIIGSPYAIGGYEPDPLIGGWEDIDRARRELHDRGMLLILDFIPNHTGIEHPWVKTHPDYFIQVSEKEFEKDPGDFHPVSHNGKTLYLANGRDPYFPPWSDTLQLNYFNPQTRQAMINELIKMSRHCDGFRCDMAMLVMNGIFQKTWGWTSEGGNYATPGEEFWTWVRHAVPGSVLIAESYWDTEWDLQQLGFDYTYDKRLYDRVVSASALDIYLHLTADIRFQNRLTRFIENHDERRSAEIFGKERLEAPAVLFSTLPGMKLYHQGQMEGKRTRVPVQMRRSMHEETDRDTSRFYEKLLSITRQDIFREGVWRLREVFPLTDTGPRDLIAYTWTSGSRTKLVVVNMNPVTASGRVPLEDVLIDGRDYKLVDELHAQLYLRSGNDMRYPGLIVILGPFRAHIFDISTVE
ncbi:MAG: alpha-amylase [Nitrospirae bacterium]|nr:alpha-amylase [Nitrospirota bacterium]